MFAPIWSPVLLCLCRGSGAGGPGGAAVVALWGGRAAGQEDYDQRCPGQRVVQAAWGRVVSRFSAFISILVTLVGLGGLRFAGVGQWRRNRWFLRFL